MDIWSIYYEDNPGMCATVRPQGWTVQDHCHLIVITLKQWLYDLYPIKRLWTLHLLLKREMSPCPSCIVYHLLWCQASSFVVACIAHFVSLLYNQEGHICKWNRKTLLFCEVSSQLFYLIFHLLLACLSKKRVIYLWFFHSQYVAHQN